MSILAPAPTGNFDRRQAVSLPVGQIDPRSIAPDLLEIGGLYILAGIGVFGLTQHESLSNLLNYLMPIILAVLIGRGALRMLKTTRFSIWTPLLWFRAAYFFYAAVGSLIVLFLNDAERTYVETWFAFFSNDILAYNTILAGFAATTMTTFAAIAHIARKPITGNAISLSAIGVKAIGAMFLGIGLLTKLFVIVPFQFGFVEGAYSTVAHQIAQTGLVGLYLLSFALGRERSSIRFAIYAVALFLSALGILAFSKTEVILPLMMVLLGRLQAAPSARRVLFMVFALPVILMLSAGPVDQGRLSIQLRYESVEASVGLNERVAMISTYFDESQRIDTSDINFGLLRLSYVNVGTYVINAYHNNMPGHTFDNALAVFVPRVLWPDKPIITDVARNLSYEMSGNIENSVAPGLAPESYWNFGVSGVFGIGILLGALLFYWSRYSIAVQMREAWHLFPILLLGAQVGLRIDGFFVADVLGPISVAVAGHFILTLANTIAAPRRGTTLGRL